MARYIAVNENGQRIGEDHHRSTISDATVFSMRVMHEDNKRSYAWIAMKLKMPLGTVKKICRYESRNQIPDHYKRVDDVER